MWMEPAPADADVTPIKVPVSLQAALGITVALTLVFGILPQVVGRFGDFAGTLLAAAT
jgi:hypothetical protein